MTLPKLYKRRHDGQIHEWQIEVCDAQYRTHSGVAGGAVVCTAWTTVQGKTRTTAEQQCLSEVDSVQRKKLKSGGYRLSLSDVDEHKYFRPMLAHKWTDHKSKAIFPVIAQPKLDGGRCVATSTGLWTRGGERVVTMPHVEEALKPLFRNIPWLVLDGEAYADKFKSDFDGLMSLFRTQKPTFFDLEKSRLEMQYHVFDVFDSQVETNPCSARMHRLDSIVNQVASPHVVRVQTEVAESESQLDELMQKWIELGFEGQMVRIPSSPYQVGKRSRYLLKRKEFQDEEFTIVRVEEGVGNRSGMAGKMIFSLNGREFGTGLRGNEALYTTYLTRADELIGELATVRYQNITPDGVPRFGVVTKVHYDLSIQL